MTIRRTITTALLAAAALALAGCAGAARDTPAVAADMTVTGTLTLHQSGDKLTTHGGDTTYYVGDAFTISGATFTDGVPCTGIGGYSDMKPGAAVTIFDAGGTIVGASALGTGTATGASTYAIPHADKCAFPFTVAHVPTGSTFYQYEISHRGRITFTADEAPFLAADLNGN